MEKLIIANYRYYISGGPEVYMLKFMEQSQSIGYESIPFSVNYSQNIETEYSKYFISSRSGDSVYYSQIKKTPKSIFRTLSGAFYNREAYKKVSKLIDDEQPKVLYALQVVNTLSPSIFKAAKKKGLKVIHRISDFNLVCPRSDCLRDRNVCQLCVGGDLKNAVKNRCFHGSKMASIIRVKSMKYHRKHKLYKYVDYFVTPTEFTRQMLIKGGFDENKVVRIPTFIDANKYIPNYSNAGYFLFLGRLSIEKGAIYAIEAMRYVKDSNIKLYVTGELKEEDEEIRQVIQEFNLDDKVCFVGFKTGKELDELISKAICVLCPAIWYDNMPNTVLEAYAYGKPVIASNIGCFPELVEDGRTGFLFEPKNVLELSDKMIMLISDSALCVSMGKNCREKVEKEFSPENHLKQLETLFNS